MMRRMNAGEAISLIPRVGLVLDVGGAYRPLGRADWILDICSCRPYGQDETADGVLPRFSAETWVQADMCSSEPWPFRDKQFEFAICCHTLEDVRDPIRVCEELSRVAKAGYIEVPSRQIESTRGIELRWELGRQAGYYHHRWLCEFTGNELVFMAKPGFIHASAQYSFPRRFANRWRQKGQDVLGVYWEDGIPARERIVLNFREMQDEMRDYVRQHAGSNFAMWFHHAVFMPARHLLRKKK